MTSRTTLGDIRQLTMMKLAMEQELPVELQDRLTDWLDGNDSLWEITDHGAFCAKVTELIAEWKTQNLK